MNTTQLSSKAQNFWKRHGEYLKGGGFFCYSRKAKKSLRVIAELQRAGFVQAYAHHNNEIKVTAAES